MRPLLSAHDQALVPTIAPVAPIEATAAAVLHRTPHPDAARSPTDRPSAGPPGARTEGASGVEGSPLDETARAQGLGLCEATAQEWRRSACNLREHAARPGLAQHVRDALLREAACSDRQASLWEAGAQDYRLMADHPPLTYAQQQAVCAYAARHGRDAWKARLLHEWEHATAGPRLLVLRDSHGPAWLARVLLPDGVFDA